MTLHIRRRRVDGGCPGRIVESALLAGALLLPAAAGPVARAEDAPGTAQPAEDRAARHWRERVEAFRKENAALPADRLNVVFVGDSITEGFPLARFFPGKAVLNRGISADRIAEPAGRGVAARLGESVVDSRPSVVFLLIGVNDLAASPKPPEDLAKACGDLVRAMRKPPKGGRAPKFVLQTVLPVGKKFAHWAYLTPRIVKYNDVLRAFAKEEKIPMIDLHTLYADADGLLPDDLSNDGLHLRPDAYARWADAARGFLPQ